MAEWVTIQLIMKYFLNVHHSLFITCCGGSLFNRRSIMNQNKNKNTTTVLTFLC